MVKTASIRPAVGALTSGIPRPPSSSSRRPGTLGPAKPERRRCGLRFLGCAFLCVASLSARNLQGRLRAQSRAAARAQRAKPAESTCGPGRSALWVGVAAAALGAVVATWAGTPVVPEPASDPAPQIVRGGVPHGADLSREILELRALSRNLDLLLGLQLTGSEPEEILASEPEGEPMAPVRLKKELMRMERILEKAEKEEAASMRGDGPPPDEEDLRISGVILEANSRTKSLLREARRDPAGIDPAAVRLKLEVLRNRYIREHLDSGIWIRKANLFRLVDTLNTMQWVREELALAALPIQAGKNRAQGFPDEDGRP